MGIFSQKGKYSPDNKELFFVSSDDFLIEKTSKYHFYNII